DAQFIIATHSPILLAFPGARIYSFDRLPIAPVAYADLDHVALTRAFLNDPETYLRRLRDGGRPKPCAPGRHRRHTGPSTVSHSRVLLMSRMAGYFLTLVLL